jgi:hypothetical protein
MKYTIVIDEGTRIKKISKIFTYSDGGFAVAVPYHTAEKGHLYKYEYDYRKKRQDIRISESDHYIASDRVKLSMHMDGFTQFSGENPGKILSGRDESGKPKGLGYLTSPLTNPIKTGPTFGIQFWGLDDFVDFIDKKSNEITIIFKEGDMYYRNIPSECDGYLLVGFVFQPNFFSGVRRDGDNRLVMDMCFRNFEASGAVFKLLVLPTESMDYFICLLVNKMKKGVKHRSGFILNAPSEIKEETSNIANLMSAMYPNLLEENKQWASLDYFK